MYFELPEYRRCCCCLPLRYGIIAFGYLHMAISCLVMYVEGWWLVKKGDMDASKPVVTVFGGVGFVVQAWVIFVLYAVDIVFCIVLLVGAHKRNTRLLRVYGYYGVTTCCASLILFIIMRFQMEDYDDTYFTMYTMITETCLAVAALGIKVYILLLIRSEIRKLKRNCELRLSIKPEEGNPF